MFLTIVGHSNHTDTLTATQEVIQQCQKQLGTMQPKAGIVFASTWYDHHLILPELSESFTESQFVGCSSGGELSSSFGFQDDSICLILFVSDTVSIATGLGLNASVDPMIAAKNAVEMVTEALDNKPSLCLAFPDNLHSSPELIIDGLQAELGLECPIFGGFASAAELAAKEVYQFYGTKVHTGSIPILVFSEPLKVDFKISNSSSVVGHRSTIDKVDGNFVTQIGGQSALSFYRDTFGPHSHPLLEMPIVVSEKEGDSYIRAAVSFDEDSESVGFYGSIPQGASVQFSEETAEGIISNTDSILNELIDSLDSNWIPQSALIFSCGSRKWILGSQIEMETELVRKKLPANTPFAGFYCFGEIAPMKLGMSTRYHNCTMIALLLGEKDNSQPNSKMERLPSKDYSPTQKVKILERKLTRIEYYLSRLENQKTLSGRMLRRLNTDILKAKHEIEKQNIVLEDEREKLAQMTELLKKMFGRYLSTEVMNSLIQNPAALELGGQRRKITIMMTDLRGFTALSERLEPEKVLQMLNAYFEVMVEIILKYHGTINEFVGDALLVIFGAPQEMPDRVEKAIACSIEMQNAMEIVNSENKRLGLPELEMGIGLNETEVIVGNIGSEKRSKYAAVGSGVNMASRIESYTVGGQILISESVRQVVGNSIRIDSQQDVFPKGTDAPLRIYEVGGISGKYNMVLKKQTAILLTPNNPIPIRYKLLEGKTIIDEEIDGSFVRISRTEAEIKAKGSIKILSNLKMSLIDADENLTTKHFYGKVIKKPSEDRDRYIIHFTSIPPEVDAYFQAIRQHASMKEQI